jgi:hypothetical protein
MKACLFAALALLSVALVSANAEVITSGPNKGLTTDQVIKYRVKAIEGLAHEAVTRASELQTNLSHAQLQLKDLQDAANKQASVLDWYKNDDANKDLVILEKDKTISALNSKISALDSWLSKLGFGLAVAAAIATFMLVGAIPFIGTLKLTPYYWVARGGAALSVFTAVFVWVRYIH